MSSSHAKDALQDRYSTVERMSRNPVELEVGSYQVLHGYYQLLLLLLVYFYLRKYNSSTLSVGLSSFTTTSKYYYSKDDDDNHDVDNDVESNDSQANLKDVDDKDDG